MGRERERERERERARRRLLPAAWGAERWVGGPYCCPNKRDIECFWVILIHFALGLTFWYILIQQGLPCMTPVIVSAKLKHEFCPPTVLAGKVRKCNADQTDTEPASAQRPGVEAAEHLPEAAVEATPGKEVQHETTLEKAPRPF